MITLQRRTTALVTAALLGVAACGSSDDASPRSTDRPPEVGATSQASSPPVTGPGTITDDLGEVIVEGTVDVIVATSDESTEMVVALGIQPIGLASTRVDAAASATDRFADYFLSAEQLGEVEFVGGEVLNFEAIAALEPDLIVHGSDDDDVETLRQIAPTVVFDVQAPGRWQTAVAELGRATGTTNEAAATVDAYDDAVAKARDQLADVAAAHPALTVIYPNYRDGDDNFVFDAEFALASVVPELGFDLVGIDAAEPAFPGVGMISTERYEDVAAGSDTIIAVNPNPWEQTPSGPFLESLDVPVLGVLIDEGRPSTGPLSAPVYLERFVAAITAHYGPDADEASPTGPRTIEHAYGTTEVPASPERIVALSEEFLLADLLALGVTPIASSSNDASVFGTIDPALTDGIEILTSASFNIERLAALRPDLIVAYPVYIELVGYDALNAVAPTVAIGDDDSDWRELVQLTAKVLGVDELGADLIAEYEEAHDAARVELDGLRVSAASIFDQSFIRAYTDGGTFLVDVMLDAGVVLVPDADSVDGVDGVGRIQLSLEQLELLQGDVLLLLQRLGIEDDGAAEVTETALWSTLPAVQADAVITLDRLAYPGAAGAAAFIAALADEVAALR